MILISFMSKTISVLCFGVMVIGASFVLGGCGSDAVNSVTTTGSGASSSSSSTSSSSGEGGAGGAGGMAGTGGSGGGMAGGGGMGGSAPACVKPGETCADCLFDQCQLAYCDCTGESACTNIIACIQGCSPMMPDCASGCYATFAAGFAEFTIVSSCVATLCAPSCPGSDQVKPCDLCLAQKCETQFETCLANTQCFPLIDCRKNCGGNMMCEKQCDMTYPTGAPIVQELFTCATMDCGNSCN